jgi:lipopolysaccharide export LptBFGC system permease protein LptF
VSSLLWPALILSLVASSLTLSLAAWPLPESHYAAQKLALEDAENLFFSQLNNGKIYIREAGFQMTVDRVVGDMLYGPTVKHRDARGQSTYCYAPYGRVEFTQDATGTKMATLALWDAVVVDEAHVTPVRGDHRVSVPLPTRVPRKAEDLSLWYLMAVRNRPELSDEVAWLPPETAPQDKEDKRTMVRASAIAELNNRLALALGCIGLVLLGASLGMYFHSGNLLTAFGVALVPWLASWLLTKVAAWWVAESGAGASSLAWFIWAPNVLMLLLGLVSAAGVIWFWGYPVRLRHRLFGSRPAAPRLQRSAP